LEDRFMWVPPPWLINVVTSGAGYAPPKSSRGTTASVPGQTTKVVRCEACGRSYAYELKRIGCGYADGHSASSLSLAQQRAEEDLQRLLAIGVEAIPCPACGWYQSDMVPEVRSRHRRGMLYLGQCLTFAVIPMGVVGELLYLVNNDVGDPPAIPWPLFVAGMVCLLAAGVGLLIRRRYLAKNFDPNAEDVRARTLSGQSRAVLLSEQKARDPANSALT
jgi:hypothetical protein